LSFAYAICVDGFGPYLKSSLAGSLNLMEVMLCAQRTSFRTLPQEVECTSITGACWTLAEIENEKQRIFYLIYSHQHLSVCCILGIPRKYAWKNKPKGDETVGR
jgi:hypothetical protein